MQHFCREYTMSRNETGTRVRGWIPKNTRIRPVLNIKVCCRESVVRVSSHLHVIHDVCSSVVGPRSVLLSFSCFSPSSTSSPSYSTRQRRGFKPLHSRRMKSTAPSRYTILSQFFSSPKQPKQTNITKDVREPRRNLSATRQ